MSGRSIRRVIFARKVKLVQLKSRLLSATMVIKLDHWRFLSWTQHENDNRILSWTGPTQDTIKFSPNLRRETRIPEDLRFSAQIRKLKEIKDWVHAKIMKIQRRERKFHGE